MSWVRKGRSVAAAAMTVFRTVGGKPTPAVGWGMGWSECSNYSVFKVSLA